MSLPLPIDPQLKPLSPESLLPMVDRQSVAILRIEQQVQTSSMSFSATVDAHKSPQPCLLIKAQLKKCPEVHTRLEGVREGSLVAKEGSRSRRLENAFGEVGRRLEHFVG